MSEAGAQFWFDVGFVIWMLLPLIWWGGALAFDRIRSHFDATGRC